MLRIAITDDQTLFRKSLRLLINSFENMQVVLEASNGVELLTKLQSVSVDILILDVHMTKMDGFEISQKVKELYPKIKILVLTIKKEPNTIRRVIQMGAHGYFTKNTLPNELKAAILKLEDNKFYFEKDLSDLITEIWNNPDLNQFKSPEKIFTERELEIIELIARGFKSKEIADMLSISPKTVNAYRQNIKQKYNFDSIVTAIIYCIQQEIIDVN